MSRQNTTRQHGAGPVPLRLPLEPIDPRYAVDANGNPLTHEPHPGYAPSGYGQPGDPDGRGQAAHGHDRAHPAPHPAYASPAPPVSPPVHDIFSALRPQQQAAPHYEPYLPEPDPYPASQGQPYPGHHGLDQHGYAAGGYPAQQYHQPGAQHQVPQPGYPPYSPMPHHGGWPEGEQPARGYGNDGRQPLPHAGYDPLARAPGEAYEQAYDPLRTQPPAYNGQVPGGYPGYQDPYDPAGGQGRHGEDIAEEVEPEGRRGPRAVVIVGALLGAIALGGGLAYGYKTLSGGASRDKPPVIRAETRPAKAKPSEPGGRQIAHTDKKFLNRLTDEQGRATTGLPPVPVSIKPAEPEAQAADDAGEGKPRKVQTLVVGRDGSILTSAPAPRAAPPPVNSVPGMLVEGLSPPAQRSATEPPPSRDVSEPAVTPPQPGPPRAAPRLASAPRAAEPELRYDPTAATPAPPRAAPRRPQTREAVASPPAPGATGAPAKGGSGYVAVLASRKSRMEALQAFADMQQKYSAVLQSRTPDVQEANLGAKGLWYRVVIGPRGSRADANAVCAALKSKGFTGCWVNGS